MFADWLYRNRVGAAVMIGALMVALDITLLHLLEMEEEDADRLEVAEQERIVHEQLRASGAASAPTASGEPA